MPEGDTIHRTARTLQHALAGRRLVRFEAQRLQHRSFGADAHVVSVEARGKHCLVHFDDGRVLHTHMRMTGSWHLYRPGERWRKKAAAARVVVEVGPRPGHGDDDGWVAVCFAAPVVELVDAGPHATAPTATAGADSPVGHLGPDLCLPDADIDEVLRRLDRHSPPDRTIGEALLDQRIAAGIGNVYKSEACFACGVHPFAAVGTLGPELRRALVTTAAAQLRANLDRNRRSTVPGGGLAVYGRRDRPCRRCGTTIEWAAQGTHRRGTYWCPGCQPEPAGWRRAGGG